MKGTLSQGILLYSLLAVSLAAYGVMAYFTPRDQFWQVIGLFCVLFLAYGIVLRNWKPTQGVLFGASILFRLVFIAAIPALSDDYFRFVWDGRLLANGHNPFVHLPGHYLEAANAVPGLTQELYNQLNSPEYFTVYPPVSQAVYGFSSWLFPNSMLGNIIALRGILLLADIGTIFMLRKLLYKFNLPEQGALLYALNPLVIVELTGNVHFEGLMLFFLVWSLNLMVERRWIASAFIMALSIGTKLVPLMFLPFFFPRLGWAKSARYYAVTGLFTALLFLPFINAELIANLGDSLDLYFRKFEFNASVYYLVSAISKIWTEWNLIRFIGPSLGLATLLGIGLFALAEKQANWRSMPGRMLGGQSILYLLATTVHPWYICTLVGLSVFTRYRFAVVWSAAATLSYYTYRTTDYIESMWLVGLEYGVVIAYLLYESPLGGRFRQKRQG